MTLDQARCFALSLPEATEEPHFDYTSFRIRGKIFATAPPDGEYLHLFLGEAERTAAIGLAPDYLEPLPWGQRILGLRVLLSAAPSSVVRTLVTQAWIAKAPARPLARALRPARRGAAPSAASHEKSHPQTALVGCRHHLGPDPRPDRHPRTELRRFRSMEHLGQADDSATLHRLPHRRTRAAQQLQTKI